MLVKLDKLVTDIVETVQAKKVCIDRVAMVTKIFPIRPLLMRIRRKREND